MVELPAPLTVESLTSLRQDYLVIRENRPHGFVAYLDFENEFSTSPNEYEVLWSNLNSTASPSSLSFSGWIGFFGYEFLGQHLGLKMHANQDIEVPDAWFGRPSTLIHFEKSKTWIESKNDAREQEILCLLTNQKNIREPSKHGRTSPPPKCNLSFNEYEKIFHRAKEAILDGETYQIKISQRFEADIQVNPLSAFSELYTTNPAPEAFLLQTPDFSIVSSSPEVVIDKKESTLSTSPIGGTYKRENNKCDSSVIERFLSDPKEVAEHNMLVDLERNDLSTICRPGSVEIKNFRKVESYSHLHHLVSTISGEIKDQVSTRDIIKAMLPGGSITGCPKVRTMEWIDQLEPCFRGPYTGSFGLISDNGNLHLNLIIRSLLILENKCYTQAGGGIVVNSTPRYEFQENKIKAQALLDLMI